MAVYKKYTAIRKISNAQQDKYEKQKNNINDNYAVLSHIIILWNYTNTT